MVIAEVGFAELFWTMLWFFFLFMFIWLFVALVSDLFRDHELSGVAKAIWIVVLVLFPFLGSLIYLIVRAGAWPPGPPSGRRRHAPSSTATSARRPRPVGRHPSTS